RESHRLVRLGRVARGLLHRLDCPVVVVPPDVEAKDLGAGPLVALASLADDSVEACRFAGRLAARLQRRLAVVHVVPLLDAGGLPYLPAESLGRLGREHRAEAAAQLEAWLAGHGLSCDERAVLEGQLLEQAMAFAEAWGSPLLVTGSSRLSAVGRALHVSAGAELAAVATIPVAVVPPRG
ncbi:MAG TPA: universal stress protein, partial [Anaeromyxobacteraceae bacterium]|nr:universal stress protein [Anaeromyxobacteraceae bacterium]